MIKIYYRIKNFFISNPKCCQPKYCIMVAPEDYANPQNCKDCIEEHKYKRMKEFEMNKEEEIEVARLKAEYKGAVDFIFKKIGTKELKLTACRYDAYDTAEECINARFCHCFLERLRDDK